MLFRSSEIGQRVPQHRNILAAAKKAGVTWIVYTSILRADTSPIDLAAEHRATEADIKASGIPYTFLRNGWYTENYTGSIGGAVAGGAFIGSAGTGKIAGATRDDFADAAVAVLTTAGHKGQTYELAGDQSFTLADLAAEVSSKTGKTIPYKNLPPQDYAKALAGFGLPAGFAQAIAGWDVEASKGALFDDGHALSKLIGRPTTPLATAVAAALQ